MIQNKLAKLIFLTIFVSLLWGCIGFPQLRKPGSIEPSRLQRAIDVNEENPHAHFLLGKYYLDKEDYRRANRHFDSAIAIKDDFEEAWLGKALVQMNRQRWRQGEELYQEVIRKFPHNMLAHEGLASALFSQKKNDQALEVAARTLAEFPNSAQSARLLGDIAYSRAEYARAVGFYRRALELNSSWESELRPLLRDLAAFVEKYHQ